MDELSNVIQQQGQFWISNQCQGDVIPTFASSMLCHIFSLSMLFTLSLFFPFIEQWEKQSLTITTNMFGKICVYLGDCTVTIEMIAYYNKYVLMSLIIFLFFLRFKLQPRLLTVVLTH